MNIITQITKSPVRGLKERNCWAFTVHTQELDDEQFKRLVEMDEFCWMLLSDTGIVKEQVDLVEKTPLEKKEMTKSQQVRFQLQLMYEIDPEGFSSKEDYYNAKMDMWIGKLKDKVKELKRHV